MIKLLHWCALRMSGFAIWLHDKGGNLECWCDERMYKKYEIYTLTSYEAQLAVPTPETLGLYGEFDPQDLSMPYPRPITMLDEWGETDGE